jgi:hypothetical protein
MRLIRAIVLPLVATLCTSACVGLGFPDPAATQPASPTPIPAAELELPRCQYLRAPRSIPGATPAPKTVESSTFVDCEWTEALARISVPDNWVPGTAPDAEEITALVFNPRDDPGLRVVTFYSLGLPGQFRSRDLSGQSHQMFLSLFGSPPLESHQRRGKLGIVSVAVFEGRGAESEGLEGKTTFTAVGVTDSYQFLILTANSPASDIKRVEDLLVKTADSFLPNYSRQ